MTQPEDNAAKCKITVKLRNPYVVSSLQNLRDANDQTLPAEKVVALCRCGHSSNKPYCDGTHMRIGFVGEKENDRVPDQVDEYRGSGITIVDNRGVCSHAGICTDNLPGVFRLGKEPWIDAGGATTEEIIALVKRCPSGALSYKIDGERHQNIGGPPKIQVTEDGPYRVTGNIPLADDQNTAPETQDHYTLCRCGKSKNKPLCNGAHWDGFKDSGTWKGEG
ncbi:MAG TPA: hypothetical protein ENI11_00355 [Actinobacteria bacterium]|nr:hypothetical protein [Actinomycetota bacterium]